MDIYKIIETLRGLEEATINELDLLAPRTIYFRTGTGQYVKADYRGSQTLSGHTADDAVLNAKFSTVDPKAAQMLGLDKILQQPDNGPYAHTSIRTLASPAAYQGSGPLSHSQIEVVDLNDRKDQQLIPNKLKSQLVQWISQNSRTMEEDTMDAAAGNPRGPKFTGYWKGQDAGTPGKHMVGAAEGDLSVEEEIRQGYAEYLEELGADNPPQGASTQPSAADTAKQLSTAQANINKLKSAGVTLPTSVGQAAKSSVSVAANPAPDLTGAKMDAAAKKTAMSLGHEMERLMATGNPGQIQQIATAIKQAKMGQEK